MFRADLHVHSVFSDGTKTPEELIELALEKELSAISITDHDTMTAYGPKLYKISEEKGLRIIPGIEFSTEFKGESIHILAYCFSLENAEIQEFCKLHKKRRDERFLAIVKELNQLGFPLDEKEMVEKYRPGILGRAHIANEMVLHGYVPTIQKAFDRFIGRGKKAFVEAESFTVEETLEIIHGAGGKAILAHPHHIKKSTTKRALLQRPLQGIECHYPTMSESQEKHWLEVAKEHDLLVTGGSDYHGDVKPHVKLGMRWTNQEDFEKLIHE